MSYPLEAPESFDTCYEHPDRRAGVRCQRCERAICPSCMVTASVGFQCRRCASAGSASSRTVTGGQVWGRVGSATPFVTYALIAANVAMAVLGRFSGSSNVSDDLYVRFVHYTPLIGQGEWWRLFTSGFLHAGIFHLAMNMWALYSVGRIVELVWGAPRMIAVYVASLLGGSLGAVLLFKSGEGATVGASGAIFGLFGAFAVIEWLRGVNPLRSGIGITILINLAITFGIPGISVGGHIGGLVVGAASAFIIASGRPVGIQTPGERQGRLLGVVALAGVCLAAGWLMAASQFG